MISKKVRSELYFWHKVYSPIAEQIWNFSDWCFSGWISKAHIYSGDLSLTHPEGIPCISVSFCRVGRLLQGWRWSSWPKVQDGGLATLPGGGNVNLNTWILWRKINIHFQSEIGAPYEYGPSLMITIYFRKELFFKDPSTISTYVSHTF